MSQTHSIHMAEETDKSIMPELEWDSCIHHVTRVDIDMRTRHIIQPDYQRYIINQNMNRRVKPSLINILLNGDCRLNPESKRFI